jgi:hypothetical protein
MIVKPAWVSPSMRSSPPRPRVALLDLLELLLRMGLSNVPRPIGTHTASLKTGIAHAYALQLRERHRNLETNGQAWRGRAWPFPGA